MRTNNIDTEANQSDIINYYAGIVFLRYKVTCGSGAHYDT